MDTRIKLQCRSGFPGAPRRIARTPRGCYGRWRTSLSRLAAADCDRAQVSTQAVLLRCSVMRPLSDIPDLDNLAGLASYYWLLIERVRLVNATAEEKQLLLSEIELWFNAARRKYLRSPRWRWKSA